MNEIAINKRATFDYDVLEKYEAGIELLGPEVKSVFNGHINLASSYAYIKNGEVWLLGVDIAPYQPKNMPLEYDSKRTRRLLLTKKEIRYLTNQIHEKGLTLVPLRVYIKRHRIKFELGLAKGRRKSDKRDLIRERETKKEIRLSKN